MCAGAHETIGTDATTAKNIFLIPIVLMSGREPANQFSRLEDSPFGDDGGDQGSRRDVEGGIENRDTGGSDGRPAVESGHFVGVALLDGNLIA